MFAALILLGTGPSAHSWAPPAGKRSRRSELDGGSDAPNALRLTTLNCNRLWSRNGRLCRSFHGLIHFLDCAICDIAMLQETNTQSNPSLPDDQPCHYEGPADTHGRDAACFIRNDRAILCNLIPNITPHVDICWRVVDHGSTCPWTATASYYAACGMP